MYFLGIDGGGSRTRALLCDASGQIAGRGLSGATNPRAVPAFELRRNLLDAIRQATDDIEPTAIHTAHLGIAGASEASARKLISQIARELLKSEATHITVGHDLETALEAGLTGRPGVVLIAGTGSASYGRNAAGQTAECGGWGDLVDDSGSGSWIGLQALQACVRQADGRSAETSLMNKVMQFLEIGSMSAFKARIHDQGLTRSERAGLAPIVIDLAVSGDTDAAGIMSEAIEGLCQLALSTGRKLKLSQPALCLRGGLTENPCFREALSTALRSYGFETIGEHPRLPAEAGALLLALKSANVTTGKDTIARLAKTSY